MTKTPGLYVEIMIRGDIDEVWRLTQEPASHQRWDLRFTQIDYLPRPDPLKPQCFLYQTRIGFGLSVRGTGESMGQRDSPDRSRTSSLRFASEDWKSLITEGSGYWRYVPTPQGVRFYTWYDYEVRFGRLGQIADRLLFRPMIGWATAVSFDRLRLWVENGQTPETPLRLAIIHAAVRCCLGAIWIWHGLVPKLLYHHVDEQTMLQQAGVPMRLLPWIGGSEIVLGLLILFAWRWRPIFLINIVLMIAATIAVSLNSPAYLQAAFNPVTLNLSVIVLAIVGWISSETLPSASRCRRIQPQEQA
jgi:uncharacterized membrane protein YphA (DoxX/SURF4 family)